MEYPDGRASSRLTSDAQFRALLEAAPDAMVIIDTQGRIVLVNSQTEHLFGFVRDEILDAQIEVLVPERFRGNHLAQRMAFTHEPRVRPMGAGLSLFGRRKDGTEFPVEISLSPLETDRGRLVTAAIRDVTERKRVERTLQEKNFDLERASRVKDQFLRNMSHELRTPLNAIMGFTGTLLMQLPGPLLPEQDVQLRIVQTNARQLLSLIDNLLDLAAIESGKVLVSLEPASCTTIVHEVAEAMRPRAEKKALTFVVEMPDADISLNTDRRALTQILMNLVDNAVKFTEQGSIRIVVSRSDTAANIAVVDTGPGVAAAEWSRLTAAFEQRTGAGDARPEGSGLGLHISHSLAALIRATIAVESEVGSGTRMTVRVPIAEPSNSRVAMRSP